MMSFISSASSNARSFAGFDSRSIMCVTPPYLSASVTVSQPYWISFDA